MLGSEGAWWLEKQYSFRVELRKAVLDEDFTSAGLIPVPDHIEA